MAKEEVVDVSELDLVVENADKIDAIKELLIEKKIITKEEFKKKFKELSQDFN